MTVFWDIAPRSLVEVDRRFKMCSVSIITAMRQYAPLKRQCTSTRLRGAISQKAVIFTRLRENLKYHKMFILPGDGGKSLAGCALHTPALLESGAFSCCTKNQ
jgi:hypothetical protein